MYIPPFDSKQALVEEPSKGNDGPDLLGLYFSIHRQKPLRTTKTFLKTQLARVALMPEAQKRTPKKTTENRLSLQFLNFTSNPMVERKLYKHRRLVRARTIPNTRRKITWKTEADWRES